MRDRDGNREAACSAATCSNAAKADLLLNLNLSGSSPLPAKYVQPAKADQQNSCAAPPLSLLAAFSSLSAI